MLVVIYVTYFYSELIFDRPLIAEVSFKARVTLIISVLGFLDNLAGQVS